MITSIIIRSGISGSTSNKPRESWLWKGHVTVVDFNAGFIGLKKGCILEKIIGKRDSSVNRILHELVGPGTCSRIDDLLY